MGVIVTSATKSWATIGYEAFIDDVKGSASKHFTRVLRKSKKFTKFTKLL
jgi:hypothetical protein